jgi:hypothetical protein
MKNVRFSICNGLNGVVHAGTEKEVDLVPGMKVSLCLDKAEVIVEITSFGDDGETWSGRVIEAKRPANDRLDVGDKVSFNRRNVHYLP